MLLLQAVAVVAVVATTPGSPVVVEDTLAVGTVVVVEDTLAVGTVVAVEDTAAAAAAAAHTPAGCSWAAVSIVGAVLVAAVVVRRNHVVVDSLVALDSSAV